ncbi:MAG TPA: hypothetical protein VFD43_03345 [Planctomycetota bacterium]|nr:hypothetical protein [Planctomycetota bacterium]
MPPHVVALHVAVQNHPTVVRLEAACPHAFAIGPLRGPTRWFREIGYVVPILSRDRDFDERWSVEAHDHEFAGALVREREARAAIAGLDELGCVALGHDRRRLTAILGRRLKDREERERHEQAVRSRLVALEAVIARLCRQRSYPHNGGGLRLAVIVVLLGLAFVAGVLGMALGADELLEGEAGPLLLQSLLVGGPLTLLLIGGLARLLAGRSASHKELGLVALLAVVGVPILGLGAAVTINRTLDDGAVTLRRVPVLELRERRGDGKQVTHFAVVPDWEEGRGPTRSLKLGKRMAAQAVAGESWLRLSTSPGRLGAERVLDLQLEAGEGDG